MAVWWPKDEVPASAPWRGLSAYAAGDSTRGGGGAAVEYAVAVAHPGYHFYLVQRHLFRRAGV